MTGGRKAHRRRSKGKPRPRVRELGIGELQSIVERTRSGPLSAGDHDKLRSAVETLAFLTRELESKEVSIQRLRSLLFGASTEKTRHVVAKALGNDAGGPSPAAGGQDPDAGTDKKPRKKRKGHGRHGAEAYLGADQVKVPHALLGRGDPCPECQRGKVYPLADPAALVRVTGMAPLQATVYQLERLRCNLCGEVSTAQEPPGVGREKYDETVPSMIGLLKYGCGLPFNRLERLQQGLGIPLPAGTQWELVERAADLLTPAYDELVRQAAQGDVLHNDDTTMKILELSRQTREQAMSGAKPEKRTGVFTSGIVSTGEGQRIAVFFTGRQHAGENLSAVLSRRAAELSAPIQMCDALSRNVPDDLGTILASCNAHARRRFVEVANSFPEECRHVLDTLAEVYRNDGKARAQGLSPKQRLRLHQAESGPLMEVLKEWLKEQLEQHGVEPNSGLGEAIGYMLKHWKKLTLFLHVPGAPLDNNICERALKKAILHRLCRALHRRCYAEIRTMRSLAGSL